MSAVREALRQAEWDLDQEGSTSRTPVRARRPQRASSEASSSLSPMPRPQSLRFPGSLSAAEEGLFMSWLPVWVRLTLSALFSYSLDRG